MTVAPVAAPAPARRATLPKLLISLSAGVALVLVLPLVFLLIESGDAGIGAAGTNGEKT